MICRVPVPLMLGLLFAVAVALPLGAARPPEDPPKRGGDAKVMARLKTALEQMKKHDVDAVPLLIDLLADLPAEERGPVEDILRELAGAWAPHVTLAGDDDISRHIRRDAWASWWRRTDGPALLNEFRKRTLTADDVTRAQELIRKLDDKS